MLDDGECSEAVHFRKSNLDDRMAHAATVKALAGIEVASLPPE